MDEALTTPVYSVSDVARLVHIHAQRARRWMMGYTYNRASVRFESPPLRAAASGGASFLDLMELLYANAFLDSGHSIHKVRRALEEAREITHQSHPFANRTIYLSDSDIFMRLHDGEAEELRSLLHSGQQGIRPVILAISRRVDFGDDGYISRWYPQGREGRVVIDPRNLGGRPRIDGTRLSTADIVALWRSSGCVVDRVASDYQIEPDVVRAAIDFETAAVAA